MTEIEWLLAALFVAIAALYSSVGHAGASGYIAAMALFGLAPATIRPTALALNVLVASIGLVRFTRANLVPWRLVLPFVLASAPMAYFAATWKVPALWYQRALALVLLVAAVQLFRTASHALADDASGQVRQPSLVVALLAGAAIGTVSGLTGTGGAIFLTPLLLFAHWATTRIASGASVVFVLANSITGLVGAVPDPALLPAAMPWFLAAAAAGALIGTQLGRGVLPVTGLRRVLAVVLVIAAGKLALF
jgi:uncharacterized membrane protein YfcA